jgi:hypothetical protein
MVRLALVFPLALLPAAAQSIVSAQSGTVHYYEGEVLLDGRQVETKFGNFSQIKEKAVLATGEGRAEVLLTPGVFLRVGENTSLKMLSSRLSDTRLELLAGSAVLEVADPSLMDAPKTAPITILVKDTTVTVSEKGLYRFDLDPAQIRVYDGKLLAEASGHAVEVKEGRVLALDGTLALEKFDTKTGDPLLRWSRRRAEYMSLASISAAKTARDWGGDWDRSRWLWNPYFGMFTFIPARGIYNSPFGFRFWSPYTVTRIYEPRPVFVSSGPGFDAGRGYPTMPRTSGGYSGTVASAPVSVAAPSSSAAGASSAPASRGGGGGGGRSR